MNKALKICKYQFLRATSSRRIWIIFIAIGLFIYINAQSVAYFASIEKIKVRPWIFPHLTNYYSTQMIIMSGLAFLFCNAPFNENTNEYLLPRADHFSWVVGHLIYIVLLTFIYIFFICVISIFSFIPSLDFTLKWGKILGTLARTDAALRYGIPFRVNDFIIGAYTAGEAMIYSFLLEWAASIYITLVMYLFNLISKKSIGTIIAGMFILLDTMIANEWSPIGYKASPVTLAQLAMFSGENLKYGLTLNYSIAFFLVGILVLSFLCYFAHYRSYKKSRRIRT